MFPFIEQFASLVNTWQSSQTACVYSELVYSLYTFAIIIAWEKSRPIATFEIMHYLSGPNNSPVVVRKY